MMRVFSGHTLQISQRGTCKYWIPVSWISGLFFGMLLAAGAGNSFFLTMRGAFSFSVSIPGLLLVTSLPFLLTAAAVYLSRPLLLLACVFFKGVSFGFCAFGITVVFEGASWLVLILLMFGDIAVLPFLMWLWLRHWDLSGRHFLRDASLYVSVALLMGFIDICFVSPFAAALL